MKGIRRNDSLFFAAYEVRSHLVKMRCTVLSIATGPLDSYLEVRLPKEGVDLRSLTVLAIEVKWGVSVGIEWAWNENAHVTIYSNPSPSSLKRSLYSVLRLFVAIHSWHSFCHSSPSILLYSSSRFI